MKTLLEIKNHYAQEQGYKDWLEYVYAVNTNQAGFEQVMNEICIRAQKAALKKAAIEFEKIQVWNMSRNGISKTPITRHLITNPENLIR